MDERPRKGKRHPRRRPGEALSPAGPEPPVSGGPRDDKPPADKLDARDRSEARRMRDDHAADRYNRLKWHETLRWLVTLVGLLLVMTAIVVLQKMIGGSGPLTMTVTSMGAAVAGFVIRLLRGRGGP